MKKKGNKKMLTLRQEVVDNPIPTSLLFNKRSCAHYKSCCHLSFNCITSIHKKLHIRNEQGFRDGVINDFLSLSRNVLVPILFHEVTSHF